MDRNQFIEFKKERDLGSMISDAFRFLREEWKPFFTTIIKISIIPILLAVASIIVFSFSSSDFFSDIILYENQGFDDQSVDLSTFFLSMGAYLLFYLIAYVMVTASAMYYVKSYDDNKGKIDYSYISTMVKRKFWSFAGLFILNGIIIFIGALFCFLPGIYLAVVLSISSCILVFHERSVLDTFSDAFTFIKGHWWETFGILFVTWLIVTVLNYVTQIPVMIYQFIQMGTSIGTDDPTEIFNLFEDPIYIGLLVFSNIVQVLFNVLILLVTIFIFFDINEQKNATGAMEKIDSLGN